MVTPSDAWRSIRGRPSALAPPCNWSVDWEVRVHYAQPDARVPDGQGDFLFMDRHIRPDVRLDDRLVTRDDPGLDESPEGCSVSAAALPRAAGASHGGEIAGTRNGRTAHQADWDFLCEARSTLLERGGCRGSSDPAAQVEAIAACFADERCILGSRAGFTHGFHPVDALLHGQHCTGRSAALAALCHTLGLPARTLNFAGHSVAEVRLDGRWRLYDNQVDQLSAGRSYMEEVADPASSRLTPRRAASYHWLMNSGGERRLTIRKGKWPNAIETAPFNHGVPWRWRFNASGVGATQRRLGTDGGHGFTLPLCPDTARALYPAEPRHAFKYNADEPCRIALNLPHTWFAAPLPLCGPAAVRKVFWLGALDGVTDVTTFLAAWPGRMWQLHAPFRAGWGVRVNGRRFPLAEPDLKAGFVPYGFQIRLPVSALREQGLNEIEIENEASGGERIVLVVYPDLVEPYTPPLRTTVVSEVRPEEVASTHAADEASSHVPS